jgi:hypothetical protein
MNIAGIHSSPLTLRRRLDRRRKPQTQSSPAFVGVALSSSSSSRDKGATSSKRAEDRVHASPVEAPEIALLKLRLATHSELPSVWRKALRNSKSELGMA